MERQYKHRSPKGEAEAGPGTEAKPENTTAVISPGVSACISWEVKKVTREPIECPVCVWMFVWSERTGKGIIGLGLVSWVVAKRRGCIGRGFLILLFQRYPSLMYV